MNDDTPLLDALDDAENAINRAATLMTESPAPIVPDLYPVLGGLVALTRVTRHFLDQLPTLTEFDTNEHYDSDGQNPADSLERAEFALRDTQQALSTALISLNDAWAHVGRIGLRLPDATSTH